MTAGFKDGGAGYGIRRVTFDTLTAYTRIGWSFHGSLRTPVIPHYQTARLSHLSFGAKYCFRLDSSYVPHLLTSVILGYIGLSYRNPSWRSMVLWSPLPRLKDMI